jgi:hypothetical protein
MQSLKTGIKAQKYTCERQHRGKQGGRSSRIMQQLIKYSPLPFADPLSSIGCNHHNKNINNFQEKIRIRTPIKSQVNQ